MKKQSAVALATLAFCAAAAAQPYGVVSAGIAKLDVDCAGTTSCDKSDTAYKLLGGYRFGPAWAGELGYMSFGKAKATDSGVTAEIGSTAMVLGLAYHQDLSADWNAALRFGLARMKTKITGSVPGVGSGSDSDTNTAAYVGVGIGYKISKAVSIDGAWDFSKSKYSKNGVDESGNVNAFSVGLTFGF